ncbi:hypothetical protein AVEN_238964-1 [Araneus ventricosus]|uniref:Uncharacterized protein n=1 Tax=Araneus ventricosus TaxID=182803 RepID=A0A4Y2TG86_ARAVE|nr:hypothetical protein AVEN_238964-1 [Araneus ventricosus]
MIEATSQHLLDCVALVYEDLLKRPDFVFEAPPEGVCPNLQQAVTVVSLESHFRATSSYYSRLSINRDRIIREDPPSEERKRKLRTLECAGRSHSSQPFLLYWTRPARLEEAVEQWINEDSTFECCEVTMILCSL